MIKTAALGRAASAVLLCLAAGTANADDFVIKGATLVQAAPNLVKTGNSFVVVLDDQIKAVGSGEPPEEFAALKTIRAEGKFLIPGLIDSHVHLGSLPGIPYGNPEKYGPLIEAHFQQVPRSYLYFGYTTVIDLNADKDTINMMEAFKTRPNIYHCSGGIPLADGYPMIFRPEETRFKTIPNFIFNEDQRDILPDYVNPEDHTPSAVVARIKADGAVCAKTFYEKGFRPGLNWPVHDDSLMAALRQETREASLPLLVHANAEYAQKAVINYDIDILVHGMWHWAPVDGKRNYTPGTSAFQLIEEIARKDIGYMPTLQVLGGEAALFDTTYTRREPLKAVIPPKLLAWYQAEDANWYRDTLLRGRAPEEAHLHRIHDEDIDRMQQSARLAKHLYDKGGKLLFGTDTPSDNTWGNPTGLNGYYEMQRWREAGIPLEAILQAATWDNARAFGLLDRYGSIATGKTADLLLLDADPTETLAAYDQISLVISRGARLERDSLRADTEH